MNDSHSKENVIVQNPAITVTPPFIWPDARDMSGVSAYAQTPPGKECFGNADLISGVIVGTSVETVNWIKNVLSASEEKRLCLILILHPAGPTRAEHLKSLLTAISANDGSNAHVCIRLRPMINWVAADGEHMTLPPTAIQYHSTKTGHTLMSIGSTGDVGHDLLDYGSLNLVFKPDDAVRDEWRRWFQYMFDVSAPLNTETCDIPQLIPAKGDPKGDLLWWKYEVLCSKHTGSDDAKPTVDAQTGEVTKTADGKDVVPWDSGVTALDPLAKIFQRLYADAWLVTVDETTRIKPLAIPVRAALLGQKSENIVGAVTQKQSFTLKILDDSVEKEVEKCRKINDLMELLTFPLSKGNRWLPKQARTLLEKEVKARDARGRRALWNVLLEQSGQLLFDSSVLASLRTFGFAEAIDAFIKRYAITPNKLDSENMVIQAIIDSDTQDDADLRNALVKEYVSQLITRKVHSITKDLDRMYQELGQGDHVPLDKLESVLQDVKNRLTDALSQRITPRPVYNRIGAPDLTAHAPDENWSQPLSLLEYSARILRKASSDRYFSWKFSHLAFTEPEFRTAMDVFGDSILANTEYWRAKEETTFICMIVDSTLTAKQKCQKLWQLTQRGSHAD